MSWPCTAGTSPARSAGRPGPTRRAGVARRFLEQFASPDAAQVAFGRPAAGAPALDQVLALAGRDVDWTPSVRR